MSSSKRQATLARYGFGALSTVLKPVVYLPEYGPRNRPPVKRGPGRPRINHQPLLDPLVEQRQKQLRQAAAQQKREAARRLKHDTSQYVAVVIQLMDPPKKLPWDGDASS